MSYFLLVIYPSPTKAHTRVEGLLLPPVRVLNLRRQEAPGISDSDILVVNFQDVAAPAANKAERERTPPLDTNDHNRNFRDII